MAEADQARKFSIEKVYTKDMSFESPRAPHAFLGEWKPEVDMKLNVERQNLDGDAIESTLTITVTVKNADETAFLVEIKQSGIFMLAGFSEEELAPSPDRQLAERQRRHVAARWKLKRGENAPTPVGPRAGSVVVPALGRRGLGRQRVAPAAGEAARAAGFD